MLPIGALPSYATPKLFKLSFEECMPEKTTTLTLLESLRARMALGKSLDDAVDSLVIEIAENEGTLHAAFFALAPFALKHLERSTVRTSTGAPVEVNRSNPAIPVAGSQNERKVFMEWGIREVDLAVGYFKSLRASVSLKLDAFKALRKEMNGADTVKDVWEKVDDSFKPTLAEHGGIKVLKVGMEG